MSKITIDNKSYDIESLSKEVKAQLASLRFAENEIKTLRAQLAAMQTARNAYAAELRNQLNQTESPKLN